MKKSSINIRYGTSEDSEMLAELGRRTFYDSFAWGNTPENMARYLAENFSPEIQAADLADPDSVFLVAEIENEVVGYARLLRGKAPPCITGSNPVEIVRMYSVKEKIGQGIGSALMQACLDEAGNLGCDTIWLDVWEKNPRAIEFYRRWDFEVVGTQTFKVGGDPQNDLLMQRTAV